MANLLEQAISAADGDHAAKIIQDALSIESFVGRSDPCPFRSGKA
jgi:hypothetical protein